ncbi:MAG: ATP-binding protein [Desulfobacteraceae bacterium]
MLQSIRSKLILASCVSFFSLCALTGLNLWSLSHINKLMILSESFGDLANNILEVRRFEKNVFLYYDKESLKEVIVYLDKTDKLVNELASDIIRIIGNRRFKEFKDNLTGYQQNMRQLETSLGEKREFDQEDLRRQGKAMVVFSNELFDLKRSKIHKTINRISMVPFAFLAIFIFLMAMATTLYSKRLLSPLKMLQKKTKQVGGGDFTPIAFKENYNDEISGLIRAFNRMALEIETNQENLLQARKMAALGTFTAGIAHELNNPINNISLTAEAFMEEYSGKLDPAADEMLEDIIVQVERANDIVRNLLDFSHTREATFSELDVKDLLHSTIKLIKNQIKPTGIKLNLLFPESLHPIKGNMRSLQQVFLNILNNANNAMPNGGAIGIRAENDGRGFVRIDISDTGQGISPESMEHIFEPFYTTKGIGKGVGLGLSVTYSLVKNHGGYISVDSDVGKGTTFSVFIPSVDSDLQAT